MGIVEKTYSDGVLISEMNWPRGNNHVRNEGLSWSKLLVRGKTVKYKFKGYLLKFRRILYSSTDPYLSKNPV